jgi:hypothetical protein
MCSFHNCDWVTLHIHRLNQFNVLSHPHQEEVKCFLCLFGHRLIYVVPSRAEDASHLPGGIAATLGGIEST